MQWKFLHHYIITKGPSAVLPKQISNTLHFWSKNASAVTHFPFKKVSTSLFPPLTTSLLRPPLLPPCGEDQLFTGCPAAPLRIRKAPPMPPGLSGARGRSHPMQLAASAGWHSSMSCTMAATPQLAQACMGVGAGRRAGPFHNLPKTGSKSTVWELLAWCMPLPQFSSYLVASSCQAGSLELNVFAAEVPLMLMRFPYW